MKRRFLSLCLAVLMLLTLLPATAFAVETMTISDEGVELIKDFEGYREFAYEDGGNWYIGYGTLCERHEFPKGVTEEEAEVLLREDGSFKLIRRAETPTDYFATFDMSEFQFGE